jgi:hypothetical protein
VPVRAEGILDKINFNGLLREDDLYVPHAYVNAARPFGSLCVLSLLDTRRTLRITRSRQEVGHR